jgi:hypothetical protein
LVRLLTDDAVARAGHTADHESANFPLQTFQQDGQQEIILLTPDDQGRDPYRR